MVKAVTVFLIFILVLGIFGKLSLLRHLNPFRKTGTIKSGKKCPDCGRYSIAGEKCSCGGKS